MSCQHARGKASRRAILRFVLFQADAVARHGAALGEGPTLEGLRRLCRRQTIGRERRSSAWLFLSNGCLTDGFRRRVIHSDGGRWRRQKSRWNKVFCDERGLCPTIRNRFVISRSAVQIRSSATDASRRCAASRRPGPLRAVARPPQDRRIACNPFSQRTQPIRVVEDFSFEASPAAIDRPLT